MHGFDRLTASGSTTALDHTRRLPVEVFELIFLWIYAICGFDSGTSIMPNCTFLSHVSRRWREVALRCQTLWADVVRPSIAATELCLSRCRTRPVKIAVDERFAKVDDHSDPYREAVRLAFSVADRADVVIVTLPVEEDPLAYEEAITSGKYLSELQFMLNNIAPLSAREIAIEYESGSVDTFSIDGLIANASPRLSIACLSGCELTRSTALSSTSLRELRLCNSLLWNSVDEMAVCFRAVLSSRYSNIPTLTIATPV